MRALPERGTLPERPTCSVVVPVRDDAAELRGLLAAIAAQDVAPDEIVVVDNGSRDDSAAVARAAGCRVVSEERPGIPAAAAAGYDAARGDLILRCDADSRPGPGWVRAHVQAHRHARPGTVAVTGPAWFDLPGGLGRPASLAYVGAYVLATGSALGHAPLYGTTMSLRADWWASVRAGVTRTADVHDDMALSFLVRPGERVTFTRAVGVGMSPRALRGGADARRRWDRAWETLRLAWAVEPPWRRLRRRLIPARILGRRP